MTADLQTHLQARLGSAYALERELGGGGMSRVFLATETALGRRVVVKVLSLEATSGLSAERFKREIALAARLSHPHIVPLLSAGEVDGVPYFTMPFVEGETLRARLTRIGEIGAADAVRMLREVASALSYAHGKGVVHRDIKPENILLSGEHALVADFGVAKAIAAAGGDHVMHGDGATNLPALTTLGVTLGTPAYMAPEQAAADPACDHRVDLYALGVVAYELLTGRAPFFGRSPQATMIAHITELPEPITTRCPTVPATLGALVMRCLEKRPEDRPLRADDVVHALDGVRIAQVPHTDERPSVAVLPMVNTSGDPENEHFSDGLTDELIGALSQVAELAVSGRTSVFALKNKGLSARAIAETLGVANVLEGSVRRAGNRLKVRVQLVNTEGRVLWSDAYDRMLTDVFAVQEEIAQAVVRALEVRLGAARGPLVRPPTVDLAAYDLYLKGLFVRRRINPTDLHRAIEFFEQAIALDPKFARAHAWLSEAHVLDAIFGSRPALEVLPAARNHAQRALELDPALADAHWAVATVALAEHEFVAAGNGFQRALALDPGHVDSRTMYGAWLVFHRRFEEAEVELERALAADPLLATAHMFLGVVYIAIGRADRAIPPLQEALELSPGFTHARENLALAYIMLGRHDDAIAECERAAAAGGAQERAALAYAYAVAGRRAEAKAIVQGLADDSGRYPPLAYISKVFAGLGDADEAFRWLERGYAEHDPHLSPIAVLPEFVPLRSDPRFAEFLRRLGLPVMGGEREASPP